MQLGWINQKWESLGRAAKTMSSKLWLFSIRLRHLAKINVSISGKKAKNTQIYATEVGNCFGYLYKKTKNSAHSVR